MLDMVLYSHLVQLIIVEADYPCPLRDYVEESCKNLVWSREQGEGQVLGDDWELATGEKMEHNPHIPKPEPVVEETREDVKEDEKNETEKTEEENATETKEEAREKKEEE
jgi:hypothetical protein